MRLYTGDESGLLKCINVKNLNEKHEDAPSNKKQRMKKDEAKNVKIRQNKKKDKAKTASDDESTSTDPGKVTILNGKVSRPHNIEQMELVSIDSNNSHIVVGRRNGQVDLINASTGNIDSTFTDSLFEDKVKLTFYGHHIKNYKYVGLQANNTHFISCTNVGNIRYQKFDFDSLTKSEIEDKDQVVEPFTMKLGYGMCRMKAQPDDISKFAVGGVEEDLKIWDINKVKFKPDTESAKNVPSSHAIFIAKNVDHDELGLRQPVWITDIAFLNPGTADTTKVVTSTGYGQVRIYDTKASKKPVHNYEILTNPITNFCISKQNDHVMYLTDNTGVVSQIDLRTGFTTSTYNVSNGKITSMAVVGARGSHLATVGLNRKLIVYRISKKKEIVYQTYLKQSMTKVLWDDSISIEGEAEDYSHINDIWGDMDSTITPIEKSKRPRRVTRSSTKAASQTQTQTISDSDSESDPSY
ncbi:WD repeat-containing protein 74 [Smittium culicis]|uniref:Ribosome biogenesis protein NSA1 n=1 Tax=Smittium culicis TaxID=133412 RepID=A0A1R1YHP7_9FUNG|nr:WD repeat-containing protein 74 [Smittium culicis]